MAQTPNETFRAFDALTNLALSVERELEALKLATGTMQVTAQQLTELPGAIQSEVKEAVSTTVEEETQKTLAVFDGAAAAAVEIKTMIEDASQSIYSRFGLWVFGILVCGAAAVWIGTAFFVPSPARIQAAIDSKAALEKQIADLQSKITDLTKDEQMKRSEVAALTKKVNKWNASNPRNSATVIPCSDENDNAKWCVLAEAVGAPVKLRGYEKQYYWLQ